MEELFGIKGFRRNFLSYTCNSELKQKLKVPGINKAYRDLKEMREKQRPNSDLIDYVYKLLQMHNLLPDPATLENKKNDTLAEMFRQQGNALYILKTKNVEALEAYNQSICYAVSKENISIGLANRSAVFFEMQMYPECLDSIRLAREAGNPERLKEKLERREKECHRKMKTLQPVTEKVFVPKIRLPVNEKIPFLAKCLSTGKKDSFGKHVVADKDIPAGTIIALEEPICKLIVNSEIYLRCANCLAEVPHLLLPCYTCTNTMFCSKECEKKAFDDFHAIECPISISLMKTFDPEVRLAVRFVIRAFVAFQGDTAEKMEAALAKIEREKKNVFDFDWSQNLSPEDIYAPFHTLWINEKEAEDKLFTKYVTSCLILSLLQRHSPIFIERFLTSPTAIKLLKNLILHHVLIGYVNGCTLDSVADTTVTRSETRFGCSITLSCCLATFSCVPNVSPITIQTDKGFKNGLITLKKIAAGEHLSSSNSSNHAIYRKDIRQKHLFERFNVICKCVACTKNYPLMENMNYPINVQIIDFDEKSLVEKYSFDFCMNGLINSTKFIRKYGHLYPIQQLPYAEEVLKFCTLFLCGKTSLRIREKIRLSVPKFDN